jgi:hypothetical protein
VKVSTSSMSNPFDENTNPEYEHTAVQLIATVDWCNFIVIISPMHDGTLQLTSLLG